MRVVFVDRRGAQAIWRLMDSIALRLVARGDEVHYARWDDGRQREPLPVPAGVQVHEIQVPSGKQRWSRLLTRALTERSFSRQFRDLIARVQPDLVHTNFAVPGASARRLAKRSGVPAVVTTQHELCGSMSSHLRIAVERTEHFADAVVYISSAVAASFGRPEAAVWDSPSGQPSAALGPGEAPQHWVIFNGIDVHSYDAGKAPRVPGRLLCLGRLVKVKGQEVLLRALPQIVVEHPEIHVRIAGTGPEEARLRQLAAGLGIDQRVEFLGWREKAEVVDELQRASLVVVPSDGTQEGFGLAAAEAMAAAAPIVATRIPVFEEVLGPDGECAVMFDSGDDVSLAAAVRSVLADPEAQAQRTARALERVRAQFTSERMATPYLELYDRLTARK